MPDQPPSQKIREALAAIIEGKSVKRVKHELSFENRDLSADFIDELNKQGYIRTTVGDVNVQAGERVPAFFVNGTTAYFGWVFWEQFTSWKLRKLWGSVIKNKLGDWEIQIPASRTTPIYANENLKIEMDIDHPPEF
ncbi:MAG: hypothetical protein ACHQQQ_08230 [Bacteroidota bacterium]